MLHMVTCHIPWHCFMNPPHDTPLRRDAHVMALVGLAHGSSHFAHLLLAPLFPVFMREFGLSFADVGLLTSVFFLVSGVGQTLSGFWVDRVGALRVLLLAYGCFVSACVTAALAQGFGMLMLAAILAGVGNAPFHPCDFSILNHRIHPKRLSYAFSVHGLSGNLGWAMAPVFLVGVSALSDWRTAYWVAGCMYGGMAWLLWLQREVLSTPRVSSPAHTTPTIEVLRQPVVWWCFSFFFLNTMTLAVIQSFGVSIMDALFGASLQAATLTLSAYMVMGALGMLVGGVAAAWAAHRHMASDRLVAMSMTAGALLLLLCSTGWLDGLSLLVLALTGFALGVAGPSRDLMIRHATPKGATGRVYGLVYAGLDAGFAVSPMLFGWLMDHGQYRLTLVGAAIVLLASVWVALGVGRLTNASRFTAG